MQLHHKACVIIYFADYKVPVDLLKLKFNLDISPQKNEFKTS